MSKKDSLTPQAKKDNGGLRLYISLMVILILFIADLYIVVNRPENFVALAGITLLLLVWVYLFINAVFLEIGRRRDETMEQYQNILKSEKASYLLLKKAFEQMESNDRSVTLPTEEIISAQKALAKVTISRSRENTDALLNSHDKVMEMLYDFEDKLLQNNQEVISSQKMLADSSAKEQLLKQGEIIAGIKEMELSLKNEIQQVSEAVTDMKAAQPIQPVYIQEPAQQEKILPMEELLADDTAETKDEPDLESLVLNEAPIIEDETLTEESFAADDFSLNDEILMPDDKEEQNNLDFADHGLLMDDVENLSDTPFPDELGFLDDASEIGDLAFMDEAFTDDDSPKDSEAHEPEEVLFQEEQLFPEDILPMEDSLGTDDRNELPEAALAEEELKLDPAEHISSEQDETAELEAAVAEELPDSVPQEKTEEKPAVTPAAPDLSNPNKMLTPEEIAALIASM